MANHTRNHRLFLVDPVCRTLLAMALLLLAWVSATPLISPAAVPASAATDIFSAERAMVDLAVVAREPHAAGTEAQMRVREYIVEQAARIGLETRVQKGGIAENIIARLPGTASTRDVLVTGHYDSHPSTPGAGDNGISVAAMMETMRALRAGSPLRNDIVFLFTDGEELGWLGAAAFVRDNPDAKDETGIVLCFDARPGNGSLNLSSTSPGDAWLIHQLGAASPPLYANSWRNADERSDSDTDCTSVFTPAGFMGFEIENESRGPGYHMATDTIGAISPRIVQAFGETMTRLARHFGDLDLNEARPTHDDAYFTVPLIGVVICPIWVTPAAAVAGMLTFALLIAVAQWRRRFSISGSALGMLGFLGALILITLLASVAWGRLLATHPVTYDLATGEPYFEGISSWMAGIMGVAFILGLVTLYALSRRINAVGLTVSGLLVFLIVWWVAYFFLDSVNPLTNPPLAWSLLAGVAGLAILMFVRHRAWMAVLLFLAAIPIFVLGIPALLPETIQPGGEGAWVPVLTMGLILGVLFPQIAFITGSTGLSRPDVKVHSPPPPAA